MAASDWYHVPWLSVLAVTLTQVTRDRMMLEYDTKWPQYDFKNNKVRLGAT